MFDKYNLQWLTNKFDLQESIKFLFFWGHTNESGVTDKSCLSQWFPSPFTLQNITYPTAEHWMMVQKAITFDDLEVKTR